jgi:hypothetical protein
MTLYEHRPDTALAPPFGAPKQSAASGVTRSLQGLGTRSADLLGLKDWRGLSPDFPDD